MLRHAHVLGFLALPALNAAWTLYATIRGLASLGKLPEPAPERAAWPRVSLIIPACNEADTLEAATRAKLASDYPELEVVLVDDRSTDGTTELVDRLAASDPRVRAVHVRALPPGWLGKVHAHQRGLDAAKGEWILFSDADVHFEPTLLRRVVAAVLDEELDYVALTPHLWAGGVALDVLISSFMRLLVAGARLWKVRDPRSGVGVGAGVFALVRRSALERSPGLEHLRLEIADDVGFGQMMKRSGARCAVFDAGRGVSLYFYRSVGELMRGLEKNGYTVLAGLQPARMVLLAALVIYLEVGPLAALAGPWPAGPLAGASVLGAIALSQALVARAGQRSIASALVPCVGPLLLVLFMVRSAVLAHARGGIVWRGTLYPLDELRAGRRFELL